jgi:hypothetical protein
MRVTLRAVLAILAAGLAVEAFGSLYFYFGGNISFGAAGVILGLGPIIALAGLLILWVGRRQWNLVSGKPVHAANVAIGLSFLAFATVLVLVGWYAYQGTSFLPTLSLWAFGGAVWASLFLTFAVFALIAYGHSGKGGKLLLGAGLAWAFGISAWIALVLTQEVVPILQTIEAHSMNVAPITGPVSPLEGALAPTYVLFVVAYLVAIRRVTLVAVKSPGSPATRQAA